MKEKTSFRHLFSFLIAYRKIWSRCSVPENLWVIMWLLDPWGYLGIILLALPSFTITGIWHLPKYDHFVCFKRQNICFPRCICFNSIPIHSCIFLLYNIHGTSYFLKGVDVDLIQRRGWVVCWDWAPNSKPACPFFVIPPQSGGIQGHRT